MKLKFAHKSIFSGLKFFNKSKNLRPGMYSLKFLPVYFLQDFYILKNLSMSVEFQFVRWARYPDTRSRHKNERYLISKINVLEFLFNRWLCNAVALLQVVKHFLCSTGLLYSIPTVLLYFLHSKHTLNRKYAHVL